MIFISCQMLAIVARKGIQIASADRVRRALSTPTTRDIPPVRFRISSATKEARSLAVERCKGIISQSGGDILDFKMFSNMSLVFQVEIDPSGVKSIVEVLKHAGWYVSLEPEEVSSIVSPQKLQGSVQITFANANGNMRIPVPTVPG